MEQIDTGDAANQNEAQVLYAINRSLPLAKNIHDILSTLRTTLASDASALLHVSIADDRRAQLEYAILPPDERALGQELDLRFSSMVNSTGELVHYVEDDTQQTGDIATLISRYNARSCVGFALYFQDRATDLIFVLYAQPRQFDAQTRSLFDTFAHQANMVMQNHRLVHDAESNAARLANQVRVLQTLNILASNIRESMDEQGVMDQVVRTLVEVTGADHAGVVQIELGGEHAAVVSEYPVQGTIGAKIDVATNPVFNELLKGRQKPILIDDIEADARVSPIVRGMLQDVGTKSLIIAPLLIEDQLAGSVGLDLYTYERKFTPEMVNLVETLTSQLAVYLQEVRARLLRQRVADQTRILDEIGSRFLALNSVEELLQEAARGLNKLIDAEKVSIRLGIPEESGSAQS